MRTITFRESYDLEELAQELIDVGVPSDVTLAEIVARSGDWCNEADEAVELECVVDEDNVVDQLGDDAIVRAYADLDASGAAVREIEDGIRYVRSGELRLAEAMFARVFSGSAFQAAERALS